MIMWSGGSAGLRSLTVVIGMLIASVPRMTAAADRPPFPTTPIDSYTNASAQGKQLKRLKISVSSRNGRDQDVRVGDIVACSRQACFRMQTPGFVNLDTTRNGKSSVIVEAAIPPVDIESLYFESAAGTKTLTGSLHLNESLVIDKDFKGGEILVVVERRPSKQGVQYQPVDSASVPFDPEWQVVYYDPMFATKVPMNFGGELSVPLGASMHPRVLGVLSRDIHETYPEIDVFPEFQWLKPASMTIRPIKRWSDQADKAFRLDPSIRARGAPDARRFSDSNGVIRIQVKDMGHIVPGAKSSPNTVRAEDFVTAAAACVAKLSSPATQQSITKTLQQMPMMYTDLCTGIAPNVWIGIANLADGHNNYQVRSALSVVAKSPNLSLQPITWFQSPGNGHLAINGFTWAGDDGWISNQFGVALGYMYSNKIKLGNNRLGGGIGPGVTSGNKLVLGNRGGNLGFSFYELSAVDAAYQDYTVNVVSSSTSVVKWGNCSTDSLASRWSAIGVNLADPSGQPRLVMLSSTSTGTTTAAALCQVFKALHVTDAIRLDGGPSAVFSVAGYPKNELQGLYYLKYGSFRHIAYAITL